MSPISEQWVVTLGPPVAVHSPRECAVLELWCDLVNGMYAWRDCSGVVIA